jgi:carbon-monoxide dehydrogenase medium subunit
MARFVEFARRHGDFAIVSAAALLERDGAGKITPSVTIGGIGGTGTPRKLRRRSSARSQRGNVPCRFRSCRKFDAIEDIHAPASYRQHLAVVLSRRALEKAASLAPKSTTSMH